MTIPRLLPLYLQRLWFLHHTAATPGLLNIGVNLEIQGVHDPAEVRTAFEAAVGRHEAFRLRFNAGPAGPEWSMDSAPALLWDVAEASNAVPDVGEELLSRIAAERHRDVFDVERGPLVAATCFAVDKETSLIAITAHHLIADARALRVLVEDILEEWRLLRGEPVRLRRRGRGFSEWLQVQAGTNETPPSRDRDPELPRGAVASRGHGEEHAIRLGAELMQRLQSLCGQSGVTLFTGLLAGVGALCSEAGLETASGVGIVLSDRDLRHYGRTVGSFVRMVPLHLGCIDGPVTSFLRQTGEALAQLRTPARSSSPALIGCRVMVSMVRDSGARLHPPNGISIRQRRRKRIQAECDLHLFLHDLGDDVEVVLNYDGATVALATARAYARRYVEILYSLATGRTHPARFDPMKCWLHHIGLAVWEMDIAMLRLAALGVGTAGDIAVDEEVGVALLLAGPVAGVHLELVAPLRQEAPCMGALTRDGEGPYHCCWQVEDVNRVQVELAQRGVAYTPLTTEGPTPLFPSGRVSFAFVRGVGLVEWLTFSGAPPAPVADGAKERLRIRIESTDLANAGRFLEAMGCSRQDGPSWGAKGEGLEFTLLPSGRNVDGVESVVDSRSGPVASLPMATTWWSRVRLTATSARTEPESVLR